MKKLLIILLLLPSLLRGQVEHIPGYPDYSDELDVITEEVIEIERHLHSAGSWFGQAIVPVGETHVADRLDSAVLAFEIDAGDESWGSWIQILGSDDTPARTSQVYFDPHEIVITYTERAAIYFIQFTRGESGEVGYSAGNYTELVYESTAVGAKASGITKVQTGRAPTGSKLWARCLALNENTATISFYLGIHEYRE